MQKIIVICGPTASGKTDLSIKLAKKIGGEIISADSMQIYSELDIGTAKATKEEMQGIEHYLISKVNPTTRYSVSQYKKDAEEAIKKVINKDRIPIIVGGTGLYINSLIYGIDYPDMETDLDYRKQLEEKVEKEGLESLYNEACKIDENAIKKISPNDKKRILRVLEIYHQTGKTKTELEIESRKSMPKYDYKVFILNIERDILYARINKRVDLMVEKGLKEEVEILYKKYNKDIPTALQAIGYKEMIEHIEGKYNLEQTIEKIKMESRRYAKRQITWFKKIKDAIWLNGLDNVEKNIDIILKNIN